MTTTELDLHGERFTPDEIRYLFDRMDDGMPLVVLHDMSTEPIARSFNKQLKELPSGELAITVDIEVFNEEAFAKFGGMSIGLVRQVYPVGRGEFAAALTLNTRQFDVLGAARALGAELGHRHRFEVAERVEKAAEVVTAIVVIAGFVGLKVLESFIGGVGSDLYTFVKNKLRRRDDQAAPIEVHFHLHLHDETKIPVVVLNVPQNTTADDLKSVNAAAIREVIAAAGGEQNVQRVVGAISPTGDVKVSYVVDSQGRPITVEGRDA